jgi:biopolymer transport protein ExbB
MSAGEMVSTLLGSVAGWVLIALAVVTILVAVERGLALSRASIDLNDFLARVRKALITNHSPREAIKTCEELRGPAPSIVKAGLLRYGHPRDEIARTVATAGLFETGRLERRLPVLRAIARVAPMVGFLGTAVGAIDALDGIGGGGTAGAGAIASAFEPALVPAVAGLLIGILAQLAQVWTRSKADRAARDLETAASTLLETLGEMEHGGAVTVAPETGREVPTR